MILRKTTWSETAAPGARSNASTNGNLSIEATDEGGSVPSGRIAAEQAPDDIWYVAQPVSYTHLDVYKRQLPDSSTVAECREIIHRYRLAERFPPDVRAFFDDPNLPETPALTGAAAETLLSSDDLIGAAREMALALGYEVIMDTRCV